MGGKSLGGSPECYIVMSFRRIVRSGVSYIVYLHGFSIGAPLYEPTLYTLKQLRPYLGVGGKVGVVVSEIPSW